MPAKKRNNSNKHRPFNISPDKPELCIMKNHKKYSHWMSNNSFESFFKFQKSYCFVKRFSFFCLLLASSEIDVSVKVLEDEKLFYETLAIN